MSHYAYGMGWSSASAGPLDLFKMTVGEGGIRSPLILAGPGIDAGVQNDSFAYVWDLMPTILDIAGIDHPEQFKGRKVEALRGRSLKDVLTGEVDAAYESDTFIGGEMGNGMWMRQGDFKAVAVAPPYGSGEWHLYNVADDPGETQDLAETHSELLDKLKAEWSVYADDVGVVLSH